MSAPAPDNDTRQYWAAAINSNIAAANINERVRRYRQRLRDTGRAEVMLRGFRIYYGHGPDGQGDTSKTGQSGDQGEWVDVTLNKFATLVTQSTVRTTAEKPAFRAIATNADSASLEQASFGQGLLEYYSNTHAIADRDYEMVQIGNICLEGWEIHGWDSTKGKNLTDFAEGEPLNEGDVDVHSSTPFRVAYDPDAESVDKLQWIAFKRRYNRFDLAKGMESKDPVVAQLLLDMAGNAEKEWEDREDQFDSVNSGNTGTHAADLVWVWEFRHLPTAALPNGRLVRYVNAECVLYDSFSTDESGQFKDFGYPYGRDELHAYRYCPETVVGSIAGHAPSKDLQGLQELKDTVATQAATAANAGGVTNMWCGSGGKPTLAGVIGAMNFVQSPQKPEILEGVELSAQIPAFDAMLDKNMQERMGESDVSMGNVPKGMPGNLAALLEAKTVQYNSRGQASYAHVLERSRSGMLKLLQRFAKSDRVAVLGGKANGYKHKTWSAKDISGIDRFVVESVNPLTQTFAGKQTIAESLLSHDLITDPKQYLLYLETGRLEPLTQAIEVHQMAVRKEAELLQDGMDLAPVDVQASFDSSMPVFVDDGKEHIRPVIYDRHWDYIDADLAVMEMPLVRGTAKVASIMAVVEERRRLMMKMPPDMLAVLKCPPEIAQSIMMAQNPMMMGMPPPSMGAKPGAQFGASGEPKQPAVAGLPVGAPRITAAKPAKPPPNPLTGQQADSPVIQ